jgi:MFS family permease
MNGPPARRRRIAYAPAFCIAIHIAALAAMAGVLRGGTLIESDVERRAKYIADHSFDWTLGWGIWMLAALSIVWFYAWWADKLRHEGGRPTRMPLAMLGVAVAAIGMLCDWAGETISAFALVESAISSDTGFESFLAEERSATLLTAGAANFFYSIGGLLLMFATPDLPRRVRGMMWATWAAGLIMALSAVAGVISGIVTTTVILFPLLIVWVGWMSLRWRPA